MHNFQFGAFDTTTIDKLVVSDSNIFDVPERSVDVVSIPGRNGDLLLDNGKYNNLEIVYKLAFPCANATEYFAKRAAIMDYIGANSTGYERLTDNLIPGFFRMARIAGNITFVPYPSYHGADVTITFDCKPQLFSVTGQTAVTIREPLDEIDGGFYPSLPEIKVFMSGATGSGTIRVISQNPMVHPTQEITLTNVPNGVIIDSEIMNCYSGQTSYNSSMVGAFPVCYPGPVMFSFNGNITKLEVVPRYYVL